MLPYVKIFTDMRDTINLLSDSEAGRLLKALMAYVNDEGNIELLGQEKLVYSMLKNQIDRDSAKYQAKLDIQRDNGKKGGRPRKEENPTKPTGFSGNPNNPSLFLETQKTQEKEEEKEKEEEQDKDRKKNKNIMGASPRFTPPTADEVRAYCDERHNTVDAERFVDFYSAKGWKIGKEPMKDWKAAVRTWERSSTSTAAQTAQPKKSTNPFLDMLKGRETVEVVPDEGGIRIDEG